MQGAEEGNMSTIPLTIYHHQQHYHYSFDSYAYTHAASHPITTLNQTNSKVPAAAAPTSPTAVVTMFPFNIQRKDVTARQYYTLLCGLYKRKANTKQYFPTIPLSFPLSRRRRRNNQKKFFSEDIANRSRAEVEAVTAGGQS